MSRSAKANRGLDCCADCSAHEPSWASLNRGVLICDECCSVHRSLGRHVSQAKSLRKGSWCQSQLAMVRELHATGANSIWEHSLLDPSGFAATISNAMKMSAKRKPSAKDPLHPNKADFIRAKYQQLAFVNKSLEHDAQDVSEQLHSSVRTPNLKTSLRLLAAGADPNYVHIEKGNSPLHVAANSGQLYQIELLLIYGADPRASDIKGKQAIDYAKANNFAEIVERLNASQYEVTDRLTRFVCGKTADHEGGQHFLVPEMKESADTMYLSRAARSGLQALPNRIFEELCKDVYEEVDRRETDEIVASLAPPSNQPPSTPSLQMVPFLPVNANYSSTRNQGRQKLARYNTREFATLIVDIISEARRRQLGLPLGGYELTTPRKVPPTPVVNNRAIVNDVVKNDSDSEPLYDEVPSDDDSDAEEDAISYAKHHQHLKKVAALSNGNLNSNQNNKHKSSTNTLSSKNSTTTTTLTPGEYKILQSQLYRSDNLVQELVCSNKDMRGEISRLQVMVQKLIDENGQLRCLMMPPRSEPATLSHSKASPPAVLPRQLIGHLISRPQSMFAGGSHTLPSRAPPLPPREDSGLGTLISSSQVVVHDGNGVASANNVNEYASSPVVSMRSDTTSGVAVSSDSPAYDELEFANSNEQAVVSLPTKEEVFRKTEHITKRIQDLLAYAQDGKHESYLPCAEKIGCAVDSMIQIFPETFHSHRAGSSEEQIYMALSHLRSSAVRLHGECSQVSLCRTSTSSGGLVGSAANSPIRSPYREANRHVTQQVIQSAYDIAKAAKLLVTMFQ